MRCHLILGLTLLVVLSQAESFEDDERTEEEAMAKRFKDTLENDALNDPEPEEDEDEPEVAEDRQSRFIRCTNLGGRCGMFSRCCGSTICNPGTKTCANCIGKGDRCTTWKRKCCSGSCKKAWYQWNGVCG